MQLFFEKLIFKYEELENSYWKNERNGHDQILYQWFKVYEINYLDYSNMFSVTKFAWTGICGGEFDQIIKTGGTPGYARVIIKLSRIMV